MPSWSQSALPQLYAYVVNDVHVSEEPWYNIEDFKSAGGTSFKSFAKFTKYGQGRVKKGFTGARFASAPQTNRPLKLQHLW